MCEFFSCVSDGKGKIWYFDYEIRQKIIKCELDYSTDSHSSIADYFKLNEDRLNKYEYNPLTKVFTVDQISAKRDDRNVVKEQVRGIDFKELVPELIIKKIKNPLFKRVGEVTKQDIKNLRKWDSVWDSVGGSVRGSVGGSVRDSVLDSVRCYTSSFFRLNKWRYIDYKENENPFQPCIDLWERGFVPSFDGKTWRLHKGKNATICYEWETKKNNK